MWFARVRRLVLGVLRSAVSSAAFGELMLAQLNGIPAAGGTGSSGSDGKADLTRAKSVDGASGYASLTTLVPVLLSQSLSKSSAPDRAAAKKKQAEKLADATVRTFTELAALVGVWATAAGLDRDRCFNALATHQPDITKTLSFILNPARACAMPEGDDLVAAY